MARNFLQSFPLSGTLVVQSYRSPKSALQRTNSMVVFGPKSVEDYLTSSQNPSPVGEHGVGNFALSYAANTLTVRNDLNQL